MPCTSHPRAIPESADAHGAHRRLCLCVCSQAARHEQEVQQLHRQYAAMMQGELGKMRERLQEQYNEACGEAALS